MVSQLTDQKEVPKTIKLMRKKKVQVKMESTMRFPNADGQILEPYIASVFNDCNQKGVFLKSQEVVVFRN